MYNVCCKHYATSTKLYLTFSRPRWLPPLWSGAPPLASRCASQYNPIATIYNNIVVGGRPRALCRKQQNQCASQNRAHRAHLSYCFLHRVRRLTSLSLIIGDEIKINFLPNTIVIVAKMFIMVAMDIMDVMVMIIMVIMVVGVVMVIMAIETDRTIRPHGTDRRDKQFLGCLHLLRKILSPATANWYPALAAIPLTKTNFGTPSNLLLK